MLVGRHYAHQHLHVSYLYPVKHASELRYAITGAVGLSKPTKRPSLWYRNFWEPLLLHVGGMLRIEGGSGKRILMSVLCSLHDPLNTDFGMVIS